MPKKIEINIGDVYDKLTVIKKVEGEKRDRKDVYLCRCECGNLKKKSKKYVLKGRPCGYCGLDLDENDKPHNKYDLSGDYGIGYTSSGEEFYFDLDDYEKIYPYCWYKMKNGYICYKDETNILLHRLITNCSNDKVIDHINHNKSDNRKTNLRICTYSENSLNTKTQANSSTGFKYIKFNKQCNKYQINYKNKYYGLYDNIYKAYNKLKEIINQDNCDFTYEKCLYKNDIRKSLYIDLDGVVFDTIHTIVDLYNEDFQYYDNFHEINPKDIKTWSFEECNCAPSNVINMYFSQKRFFDNLFLMNNAIKIIDSLRDKYAITIISMGTEENLLLKESWINKNLFGLKFIGVNFKKHSDKSHIDMSDGILLDDSMVNLETSNAETKICFGDEYEWNKNWEGIRCANWCDVWRLLNNN